ncbi:hypothetical protein XHV734_0553 [Xanthomonas hortorum pv. vitians]|nr:hypothetical protein XHV734_0553 [Xanthomonas hortorum pv. vitians]
MPGGAGAQCLVRRRGTQPHPAHAGGYRHCGGYRRRPVRARAAQCRHAGRARHSRERQPAAPAGGKPQHRRLRAQRLHHLAVQLRHVRRPLRDPGGGAAVRGHRRRRPRALPAHSGDGQCGNPQGDAAVADLRPPGRHRRRSRTFPACTAGRSGVGQLMARTVTPSSVTVLSHDEGLSPQRVTALSQRTSHAHTPRASDGVCCSTLHPAAGIRGVSIDFSQSRYVEGCWQGTTAPDGKLLYAQAVRCSPSLSFSGCNQGVWGERLR